jgi:predicted small secreted protein
MNTPHGQAGPSPRSFTRCVAFACATMVIVLSGCSTTAGFGKDVKNLGSNVEDSAEKNK